MDDRTQQYKMKIKEKVSIQLWLCVRVIIVRMNLKYAKKN